MADDPKDSKPPAPQGGDQAPSADSGQAGDEKKPPAQKGTGQLGKRTTHFFTIPPHPKTQFDEENFLTLLESSSIDPVLRPQHLALEDWQRLYEVVLRWGAEILDVG